MNIYNNIILFILVPSAIITVFCIYKLYKKTNEQKFKLDFLFLFIFIITLFIPISYIDKSQISLKEFRTLANFPTIKTDSNTYNTGFFIQFNKFINDRFFLRIQAINLINYIKCKTMLNVCYIKRCWNIKKNGYLLLNNSNFQFHLSKDTMKKIGDNLQKFNEYCNNNNIKFYTVFFPSNPSFNKDKNPIFNVLKIDAAEILTNYLNDNFNLNVYYFENILRKHEHEFPIFYKTDHHLTDDANYIVYKEIISILSKDFPLLKATPLSDFIKTKNNLIRSEYERDFHRGTEGRIIGFIDKKTAQIQYTFYDYKHLRNIKITTEYPIDHKFYYAHQLHYNKNGTYKILLIGDSFQESLIYFLNTSFKKINKFRISENKPFKDNFQIKQFYKLIENFKPDIILFIKSSQNLELFESMYDI